MPYRDDRKALADRRADLARRLETVERDAARLKSVVRDADLLRRELADVDQRIAAAGGPRTLPVLDDLRVASPCHESWDAMTGDERVRFCGSCQKNVYNLSSMTRVEAESLLHEHEGRVCVRFYRRADGTVLTTDCPVGQKKRRRRLALIAVGASAVAAAGAAFAMASTTGRMDLHRIDSKPPPPRSSAPDVQPTPIGPVMGDPAVTPSPPPVQGRVHVMGHVSSAGRTVYRR